MAVRLKNGAVFLHIPKTGGSWVTQGLRDCGLVDREFCHIHADMVRVRYYNSGRQALFRSLRDAVKSRLPRRFKAAVMSPARRKSMAQQHDDALAFTFCFVRHPLRWYQSWWQYMTGRSGSNWAAESDLLGWHPCSPIKHCGDDSYERFIRNVIDQRPGFVSELFAQYAQPEIGFIGKQERLTDDLVQVLKQQGLDFDEQRLRDYPHVNVSDAATAQNSLHAFEHNRPLGLPDDVTEEITRLEYVALTRYGYATPPAITAPIEPS